ncbi:MAG: hypothetical protein KatS3mg024_2524 [Armatimonadota bacterium]|nr:MAG: hypothetical protein KatS3mg024_2524 [Armatimonadota bacterium]
MPGAGSARLPLAGNWLPGGGLSARTGLFCRLLQTRTFDILEGQVGLVVEDTRADYDDVTFVLLGNPAVRDTDGDGSPDLMDKSPPTPGPQRQHSD